MGCTKTVGLTQEEMNDIWCTGRSVIYGDKSTSEYVNQQLLRENMVLCKTCPHVKGC